MNSNQITFSRFKKKTLISLYIFLSQTYQSFSNYKYSYRNKKIFQVASKISFSKVVHPKSLIQHKEQISCILQINKNHIASASKDKLIIIWEIDLGVSLHTLSDHKSNVTGLIKHNDIEIISASYDKTIKLWNIIEGICVQTIKNSHSLYKFGYNDFFYLHLVKFNKNTLCSSTSETIFILSLKKTQNNLYEFSINKTYKESVTSIFMLNNEEFVAGDFITSNLTLFNLSNSNKKAMKGHTNHITCIESLNKNQICTGSKDKSVKIWDLTTYSCVKTINLHEKPVRCLVKINENSIASGSDDKTIKIFNAVDGTCLKSFISQNNRPVICLLKLNDYQLCSANTDIIAILNTF